MKTPFKNDPFAMILQAFQNLYPEKKCECIWESDLLELRQEKEGAPVYGLCNFGEDGTVTVFVSPKIGVLDAAEVFAHELAHVAVGEDHAHDAEWEKAYEAIYEEYDRIGEEMFGGAE